MDYKYLGQFYQKYMIQLKITDEQKTKCGKRLYRQIEKYYVGKEDIRMLAHVFALSLPRPQYLDITDDVICTKMYENVAEDDNFASAMNEMKEAYLKDKHRITQAK